MAACIKCGTQVQDGVQFCPNCGQSMAANQAPPPQQYQPPQQQYQAPPQPQYTPPPQQYQQPPQYAPPQQQYQQPQQGYPPGQGYYPPVTPGAPPQDAARDAQDNKTMAILAYILFFIPLLTGAHKTSPFVKYHTNQGTVLCIATVAYSVVSAILRSIIRVPVRVLGVAAGYYTPVWLSTILMLLSIPFLVLCILGIINAVNGKTQPLPVIGGITIIK